jgi:CRP-like cAMP-binding protein
MLLVANCQIFDPVAFLSNAGLGRRVCELGPDSRFYSQGDPADCIYYLRGGRARLTVTSRDGKEATLALLSPADFIGEESISGNPGKRLSTAVAITPCDALRIERCEMLRALHQEHALSDMFLKFLLLRAMRTQADLIDQLFNSSEKRLARALLLMAEFGRLESLDTLLPHITQETLAEMIGVNRSRVNFLMNRFRELGFVEYKGYTGRIRVHKPLLTSVLDGESTSRRLTL